MTTTSRIRAVAGPALVAALAGAVLAAVVSRLAPAPSASVARGSEDAFATGLHRREIPPRGRPQRWTTESARLQFRFLSGDQSDYGEKGIVVDQNPRAGTDASPGQPIFLFIK